MSNHRCLHSGVVLSMVSVWAFLLAAEGGQTRAGAAPGSPFAGGAKVFDVRQFGAAGDGTTVDTAALQKAINACGDAGGGIVQLMAGTYLSRPIVLRSKVTLQLDEGATLQATTQHTDFMKAPGDWLAVKSSGDFIPLISGKDLTDIAITGPGTIDGAGQVWWGAAEEARRKVSGYTLPRPNLIVLTRCKNVRVAGVTIRNSPKFHLVPTECEDVVIEDVKIHAPSGAANTDAIDPSVSRRVQIRRCLIDVGDDNVAIKSGKALPGRAFACEDITVTDCTFLHGHGMSIGSEAVGGVRNVTVERCTFRDTENGIRIKTPRGKGGTIENLRCTDITMTNVDRALTITCYYPKIPPTDAAQPVTPQTPILKDIRITNLTATCPKEAGVIIGLPESLVANVTLTNVRIAAQTGLTIRNAKAVQLKDVRVEVQKGQPLLLDNAQVQGLETTARQIRGDHGHHGLVGPYQVEPDLGRGLLTDEEEAAGEGVAGAGVGSGSFDSGAQTAGARSAGAADTAAEAGFA